MATATVIKGPAGGFTRNSPHHALHMSTTMPCQLLSAQHNISTLRARTRAALDHADDAARYARRRRLCSLVGLQLPPQHAAEVHENRRVVRHLRVDAPRKKYAPFHSV